MKLHKNLVVRNFYKNYIFYIFSYIFYKNLYFKARIVQNWQLLTHSSERKISEIS